MSLGTTLNQYLVQHATEGKAHIRDSWQCLHTVVPTPPLASEWTGVGFCPIQRNLAPMQVLVVRSWGGPNLGGNLVWLPSARTF